MRGGARAGIAAALVALGLGVPLVFMWVSGLAAAEAERDAIIAAPEREARRAAERIAERVSAELAELAQREGARPYYQWQSLIVDPRGVSEGEAVVPSPLAEGPTEPLVSMHFQIDEAGEVTSPQVNQAKAAPAAAPEASERLAELRLALRGRRAAPGLGEAEPSVDARRDADANDVQAPRRSDGGQRDDELGQVELANGPGKSAAAPRVKEQIVSKKVYQQNASAPELFEQIQSKQTPKPQPFEPGQVTVRVGEFAWEWLALAGREVLAATRQVQTPDGATRQGFTVDPTRLDALLRDGELSARLTAPGASGVEARLGLPGTTRVVAMGLPDPVVIEAAARVPIDDFWWRSLALTALALLAAGAIIALVIQTERLLERRQRFAAAAAHELRTPLAGLRMYAEMLAHGLGKPEKQAAYAARLASEAARLGRVVSNVLDFTRLERKSLAVNATSRDLAAAVADLVRDLDPSLVTAGAAIELVRPSGPLLARFDPDALAQILGNLLDNAEKYCRDARDRTITVTVAETAAGAEVRVADRGPGLPPARKLFRPFARGAPRDGPTGLGLGLALARALARAQGGDLVAGQGHTGAELIVRLAR